MAKVRKKGGTSSTADYKEKSTSETKTSETKTKTGPLGGVEKDAGGEPVKEVKDTVGDKRTNSTGLRRK